MHVKELAQPSQAGREGGRKRGLHISVYFCLFLQPDPQAFPHICHNVYRQTVTPDSHTNYDFDLPFRGLASTTSRAAVGRERRMEGEGLGERGREKLRTKERKKE